MVNEKLMVFESNPDFSDNSRGLWEYVNNNTDFETCWVVKNSRILETLKNNNIVCVLKDSAEAESIIRKAKYLITSSFEFAESKNKEQVHVSAWHGFPLKLIGFFESASVTSDFSSLKIITTQSDIITCTSKFSQLTIGGMFSVDPRKVRITGFPRNDILFNSDGRKNLEKLTGLKLNDSKLIFYLPTMRQGLKEEGKRFNENIFNYNDYELKKLDAFLKDNNAYIFAKLHFADNSFYNQSLFELPKRIIFLDTDMLLDKMLTIYHLMNAFDVLITDYSSVYVDYLLLNKPIIFSCPDIEKYKEDRGFIVDDPKFLMPGKKVKNQVELIDSLKSIFEGVDDYKIDRENKMMLFHSNLDENSSKRLFDEMMKESFTDANKEYANLFLPNYSPLYQYTLLGVVDCYFDKGEGYSELEKEVIHYSFDTNHKVEFNIKLPPQTINVRFDPDRKARWILKNLEIKNQNELSLPFSLVNAVEKDGDIILVDNDSQIHINDISDSEVLHITYIVIDSYTNIEKLYNTINQLEQEMNITKIRLNEVEQLNNSMINSTSWKLTKPFRMIKRVFKKF